jgi:hypothetical protein
MVTDNRRLPTSNAEFGHDRILDLTTSMGTGCHGKRWMVGQALRRARGLTVQACRSRDESGLRVGRDPGAPTPPKAFTGIHHLSPKNE